jgi:DNA mismatch endonuclease (patch repair protein)
MVDIFDRRIRSRVMSAIRSSGNRATELRMVELFRSNGIVGWRRRYNLFGNPDFVFPKQRVAVFVDGCFWHACPRHYRAPTQNAVFWSEKRRENRRRDRLVTRTLISQRWTVCRIWEHSLNRAPERVVAEVRRVLSRQS